MYPIAGVSVLLTIISFVLVILTIFAGNKPGFMEDYHILYFNTSTLGENLIPNLKARLPMPEPTATPTLLGRFHASPEKRDVFGDIASGAGDAVGQVGDAVGSVATAAGSAATEAVGKGLDALQDIQNDLADELAKKLGIKEFYSIHLVDLCQGDFSPKATDPKATFDVKNCTEPFKYDLLNITALLDKQLSVGPLSLNIADLGLTDEIQDKLDLVPQIIQAIVAMYIIAAIFIILLLFGSCAAIVLINKPRGGGGIIKGSLGLAGAAVLFLLIGNLITSIGGGVVVDKVNEVGDDFGLSAGRNDKFLSLSWAAFVLMLFAVAYWVYEFFAEKKRAVRRAEYSDDSSEFNCVGQEKSMSNFGSSQAGSASSFDPPESHSYNGNLSGQPQFGQPFNGETDDQQYMQYEGRQPFEPSYDHDPQQLDRQYPEHSFNPQQSFRPEQSHYQQQPGRVSGDKMTVPVSPMSHRGARDSMQSVGLNDDVSPVTPSDGRGNKLPLGGHQQHF